MTNITHDQNIERSSRVRQALNIIDSTLMQYGYVELNLPIYEYYDLLSDTVFNFSDESIIRFIDRHTGKTLVLRPDFTPQVCRIVSGIDNITLPFRASYKGTVFRSVEKDRGVKSEENQTGWEIFGEESMHADMEIVLLCNDVLKNLGLSGFSFTFGDRILQPAELRHAVPVSEAAMHPEVPSAPASLPPDPNHCPQKTATA